MADYSTIILSYMAENKSKTLSAVKIAKISAIPEPTVSKILKILSKANIIASKRGINGGYILTKDIKDISIEEIITAVDGVISITQCATNANTHKEKCIIGDDCSMRGCWVGVNEVIRNALLSVSLADMIDNQKRLAEQKSEQSYIGNYDIDIKGA